MTIDIDALREYLTDYCGTAAWSGFPAALLDVIDIDGMNPKELVEKAQELGVSLERFAID